MKGVMKTAELTGAMLAYWVARALGLDPKMTDQGCVLPLVNGSTIDRPADGVQVIKLNQNTMQKLGWGFSPHSIWAEGGPIIERELLTVSFDFQWKNWRSAWSLEAGGFGQQYGPTPLIAAMRAYAASKFGEEVPDEVA